MLFNPKTRQLLLNFNPSEALISYINEYPNARVIGGDEESYILIETTNMSDNQISQLQVDIMNNSMMVVE